VNEFVEECRREWRRLRVPDAVADEMAADLEADLAEAEAEGVSAEAVVGSGASNPRSFATAWATERGVLRRSPETARMLAWMPLAIAALALIAITGAVLTMLDSPSRTARQALPISLPTHPAGTARRVVSVTAEEPVWISAPSLLGRNDSGADFGTAGSVLLLVGLGGIVFLTLFSFWAGHARRRSELG
jgi:hypothetical protein